jgi:hypothetical protein
VTLCPARAVRPGKRPAAPASSRDIRAAAW